MLSCIDLMETALLEFPNNYQFLLNLADSLLSLSNAKREQHEKVSLICKRILDNCVDDSIRQKALYMSVKVLSLLGKKDQAYDTALTLSFLV